MNYRGHSLLQAVSPGNDRGKQVGSGEAAVDGGDSVYPMDEDDVWIEGGEALQGEGPQVVADQAEDRWPLGGEKAWKSFLEEKQRGNRHHLSIGL